MFISNLIFSVDFLSQILETHHLAWGRAKSWPTQGFIFIFLFFIYFIFYSFSSVFFFLLRSLSLYCTGLKTPQALEVKGEGQNALGGGGGSGGRGGWAAVG